MERAGINQHQRISNISGSTRSCKDQQRLAKEDCQSSFLLFLGPFRPVYGNHSLLEAGGSAFLPQTVLLFYRLFCTCGFVFTLVLFTATGDFHFTRYGEWLYLGSALAMCLALFSSLCLLLCSELPQAEGRLTSRSHYILANITVPTFQIFLTLTLVADVLYWSLVREPLAAIPKLLLYAISAVVMLIDSALACMMKYRVWYVLFGVLVPSVWLVFGWIRFAVLRSWMYERVHPSGGTMAGAVLLHVLLLMAPLLVGLGLVCVNRVQTRSLIARSRTHATEKDGDSKSHSDGSILGSKDGFYVDLASVPGNASSFISLSAPLPMFEMIDPDAVPVPKSIQESKHCSEV